MTEDLPIVELADRSAWDEWLELYPASTGVWLKIAKKGARPTTVTHAEALEVALCHGWIDGQRRPLDDVYFLQRFTPRRPRSRWSKRNREKAQVLIDQGAMRPAGLAQVQAAQADGRWEAAYEPQSEAAVPEDFRRALKRRPEALAFFETLTGVNRYAFLYRIADARRPETRARRIASFVEMLADRRTFYP